MAKAQISGRNSLYAIWENTKWKDFDHAHWELKFHKFLSFFHTEIFFPETTYINIFSVKIWSKLSNYFSEYDACSYVIKMRKLASSTTLNLNI